MPLYRHAVEATLLRGELICAEETLARVFVAIGGLVVLLLTAALVVPHFVDWTSYRADFEREMSRVLGRDVTVEGDARARLLPFPSVTFTNVTVAGDEPGEPAMTIEEFSMDAELAPFMRGEVLIFDMRLVRPEARISISDDGMIDWAVRPSAPFDPAHIAVEKLTVSEGRVLLWHRTSGREHRLTEVNADLSARTIAGPWRIDGSLRVDGILTAVSLSTGTRSPEGKMRVRATMQPEPYPVTLETDGDVTIDNGKARYRGGFRIAGRSQSDIAPREGEGAAFRVSDDRGRSGKQAPYRTSGRFSLDHQRVWVEEFRFESGPANDPYTADGQAVIEIGAEPRFSINADGAQIRFTEAEAAGGEGGMTFAERFAALKEAILDLPRPTMPGRIDVKLPAIVAGDTTIRDIVLSAEPHDAGWRIGKAQAVLPGRTTLEAEGLLSLNGPDLGFKGGLLMAIGQPSGFAAWIARDVDEAIRRLPAAGFNAKVDLSETRQVFSDLELALGDAVFRGRMDYNRPSGTRPSIAFDLSGGLLDIEGMAAFASLFISDTGANRLAELDVDLKLKAGPVVAEGMSAETVDTALRLRQGDIEIDRLSVGGLAGADISATGRVRGLPLAPTGRMDAAIVAADLAPLAEMLAARFPQNRIAAEAARRVAAYPLLATDAEVNAVIEASTGSDGDGLIEVQGAGEFGGTAFSSRATLRGTGLGDRARLTLAGEASNGEAAAIYALIGLPALDLGVAGRTAARFVIDGSMSEGFQVEASLTGDQLAAGFEGNAVIAEERVGMSGIAKLKSADIEPWLMTAAVALPGMGFGTPVDLAAEADYRDGLLVLGKIAGNVAGDEVSGDLNLETGGTIPHVTGAISVESLDAALPAALLFGEPALSDGEGRWPDAPFRANPSMQFTADVAVDAEIIEINGKASAGDASFRLRIGRDEVAFSDLSATYGGGRASAIVDLRNDSGTGLFSAQVMLKDVSVQGLFENSGIAGAGELSAVLSASGKSIGALVDSLSGSGSAKVDGLEISGIDPAAFIRIIEGADRFGRDIDASATAAFAPAIIRDGALSVETTQASFTIAGGVLRAPPLRLDAEGASVTSEIRADLRSMSVSIDGQIVYEPGIEALVGSEPAVRFTLNGSPGEAELVLDTEPLAQFLTQRALEFEQARVEAMQSGLLERQRIRREARYYAALSDRRAAAAAVLRMQKEAEQMRAAEEASRRAMEVERLRLEEDERRRAEEEERRKADEEAAARLARQAERAAAREAERTRAEQAARKAADERRNDVRSVREPVPALPDAVERVPLPSPAGDAETPKAQRENTGRGDRLPGVRDMFRLENLTGDRFGQAVNPGQ